MKMSGKVLLCCLHISLLAALCLRGITAPEIDRLYQSYYNDDDCPALVLETGEEDSVDQWLEEKKKTGEIKRADSITFYYKDSQEEKVYRSPDGSQMGKQRAAFTGQRRLTVKQEIWVPVKEVFQDTDTYEAGLSGREEFVRYHIWCENPGLLFEEAKDENLEELYLTSQMPFYRHTREVKDVSVSVLEIMSTLLFIASGIGYLACLCLHTLQKQKEIRIYRNLGASEKQFRQEVVKRLFKESLKAWAGGMAAFILMHKILVMTACRCFRIPFYPSAAEEAGMGGLICAAALLVTTGAGYGIILGTKNTESRRMERLLRKSILLVSVTMAMTSLLASFMLGESFSAMDKEVFIDRKKYDAVVYFDTFLKDGKIKEIMEGTGMEKAEPAAFLRVRLKGKKEAENISVIGIRKDTTLWQGQDKKGGRLAPKENGVLLSEATKKRVGAEEGDTISFYAEYGGKSFEGDGAAAGTLGQQTQFQEAFDGEGLGYANAVMVTYSDRENLQTLYEKEHVAAVMEKETERENYEANTKSVRKIQKILMYLSVLLLLFVINSAAEHTAAGLTEEIDILRKMGCPEKRIHFLIFSKLVRAVSPGAVIGTLTGYGAGCKMMEILSTDSFLFLPVDGYICILWTVFALAAGVAAGYVHIYAYDRKEIDENTEKNLSREVR